MKALTLKAEFADQVLSGEKIIENRSWGTHGQLAGKRIAIHRGGQGGAIVCTVIVKAVIPAKTARKLFPKQRKHICGPVCWVLSSKVDVEPAPIRGQLGLWEVPHSLRLTPIQQRDDDVPG